MQPLASLAAKPLHACVAESFEPAMSKALTLAPGSASAAAAAFLASCAGKWSDHDARRYFASTWKAGGPTGASCSDAQIFGRYSDGGKIVCKPRELFITPCNIISIGSGGDASFESSVHAFASHCNIETHDGTLVGEREKLRKDLPAFVKFVPENMNNLTYLRLQRDGVRHISLLKIDCEGCEFSSLLPLIRHICVDQIALELHAAPCTLRGKRFSEARRSSSRTTPFRRVMRAHTLLTQLDELYHIFDKQPNTVYSDGTIIEFAFVRRIPCSRA